MPDRARTDATPTIPSSPPEAFPVSRVAVASGWVNLHTVALDEVAEALTETDAMTANDGETLHPDHYIVHAENLPYLVSTVLELARDASAGPTGNGPGLLNS